MKVLVTGAEGFIGKNLVAVLRRVEGVEVFGYDVSSPSDDLDKYLATCRCGISSRRREQAGALGGVRVGQRGAY